MNIAITSLEFKHIQKSTASKDKTQTKFASSLRRLCHLKSAISHSRHGITVIIHSGGFTLVRLHALIHPLISHSIHIFFVHIFALLHTAFALLF